MKLSHKLIILAGTMFFLGINSFLIFNIKNSWDTYAEQKQYFINAIIETFAVILIFLLEIAFVLLIFGK